MHIIIFPFSIIETTLLIKKFAFSISHTITFKSFISTSIFILFNYIISILFRSSWSRSLAYFRNCTERLIWFTIFTRCWFYIIVILLIIVIIIICNIIISIWWVYDNIRIIICMLISCHLIINIMNLRWYLCVLISMLVCCNFIINIMDLWLMLDTFCYWYICYICKYFITILVIC